MAEDDIVAVAADEDIVAGRALGVGGADIDDHRRAVGPAIAVADGVGEGVDAAEAGIGGVGDGAIAGVHHRAIRALGGRHHAKRIQIRITVIGQHRYDRRRIDGGEDGIVLRHRGLVLRVVVDRVNRDLDGGAVGPAVAVADGIGEGIGAVEIGIRRIGEGAVAVVHHRAVGALGDARDAQGVAVGIAVIGQHRNIDGVVLVGGGIVVGGHRRIVDRIDGDLDGGAVGPAGTVAGALEGGGADTFVRGWRVGGIRTQETAAPKTFTDAVISGIDRREPGAGPAYDGRPRGRLQVKGRTPGRGEQVACGNRYHAEVGIDGPGELGAIRGTRLAAAGLDHRWVAALRGPDETGQKDHGAVGKGDQNAAFEVLDPSGRQIDAVKKEGLAGLNLNIEPLLPRIDAALGGLL